jgi:heptosyltransferase-1
MVAAGARGPVCGPAASCAREPLAALFYGRRLRVDPALHAVERNRRLCALAAGYALDGPEVFGVRERAAQLAAPASCDGQGAVLLFTNASRASKRWPDDRWVALESALAQQGRASWLAWGTAQEREDCARRVERMRAARLLPPTTLAQIAALASRAALAVGLDTGLTHLAAAVGVPTVGIFCDYDTARVGLRGAGAARSLGGVGQTPEVRAVLDAAAAVLETAA